MNQARARAPRRRRLWITLGALLAGILLAECGLRWLLFSDSATALHVGRPFRNATFFLPVTALEEYETLRVLLVPRAERWLPGTPHPELGWVRRDLDPATLRHPDDAQLDGRRPVLLYGSSFATNDDPAQPSYEALLEESELGRRFCVLNYAAFAYGLDQTILLAEKTLPFYAERDPVVVVAFAVEDLPRCAVSFFCAPKPRYELAGDGLRLARPADIDLDRFLERHSPRVTSYLARYVLSRAGLASSEPGEDDDPAEDLLDDAYRITRRLIKSWNADCDARGLAHFLWIFRAKWTAPEDDRTRDRSLLQFLDSAGIPHVDSAADVSAALAVDTLDGLTLGPGNRHPNARGTAVLLPGLVRGIEGRYDDAR